MNIYLTEILDEILGVPEGIIETSKEIYETIIKDIKDQMGSTPLKLISRVPLTIRSKEGFNISDYTFNTVNVTINVNDAPPDYGISWKGMGFLINPKLDAPYKKFTINTGGSIINLVIELYAPLNTSSWSDIVDFLNGKQKIKLMSSFAHEMKHAYDNFKKNSQSAVQTLKYKTSVELMQPLPGLREFMFYLYYTTLTENLVRATEVASYLTYKGATKKDFLNILKETDVYNIVKAAQDFTYDKMIDDIISNPDNITAIKNFLQDDFPGLSDKDVAKKFLKNHFFHMKRNMIMTFKSALEDPISRMLFSQFGYKENKIDKEKENAIKEFEKTINKYSDDDFEKFYKNEIIQINRNASNIIKKVAKLYAYI
jgi:hypothetical protein